MSSIVAKRIVIALIIAVLVMTLLLFTAACTDSTQSLQGILENIDTVNGQITVVTEDGETHIITIDSKTQVTIDGQAVAIEALDPGTHIEIELEDDSADTAGTVEARLAKVEGAIVQFQNGELTIALEHGGDQVKIKVDSGTQIRLEDHRRGTTADLKAGTKVEVKYDPETDIALKVYVDAEEEADIEGIVTGVSGGQVTVQSEKGRMMTLTIDNTTMIEHGTMPDIKAGVKVEAKFDPVMLVAFRIEIKGEQPSETPSGTAEVKGTVTGISGNHVSLDTRAGGLVVSVNSSTVVEKDDNSQGTVSDLSAGMRIKVYYDTATMVAVKIEIEDNEEDKEKHREVEEEREETEKPPPIPHTLQGREDCLTCHGENSIEPFPADHIGRSNDICTTCHQTSSS